MAQNPNIRLAQQQRANIARAQAAAPRPSSRVLAVAPSSPQKSETELMEERLLPLRERQQRVQMGEYFGGAGLRAQQAKLAGEQTRQALGLLPMQTQLTREQTRQSLDLLPLQTQQQRMQMEEYLGGAGLRAQQQTLAGTQTRLGQAEADIGLARIGDVAAAGQRAYTMGRESEELERLRMAGEGRRLQSQMAFQPQMEALRGGIASRMAGSLGVSLPAMSQPYSSGTGYTPSWMQNYQPPQFPRY